MHDDFFLLSDLLLFKIQMSKDDFRRSLDIIGSHGCDPGKNTTEGVLNQGKICGIRNLGRQCRYVKQKAHWNRIPTSCCTS